MIILKEPIPVVLFDNLDGHVFALALLQTDFSRVLGPGPGLSVLEFGVLLNLVLE